MRRFACAIVGLAVTAATGLQFDKGRFEQLWKFASITLKNSDIITTVVEFFHWMIKSGIDLINGKMSLYEWFTKPSEVQMFDARVAHLDFMQNEVMSGREDHVTFEAYCVESDALVAFCQGLIRVAPKNMKLTLANQLRIIEKHQMWCKNKLLSEPLRRAPFSVLLFGKSNTAKSCLMTSITSNLQSAMGIKVGPEYVYDLNPSDKYMPGFDNGVNTIQMDDVANIQPLYCEKQFAAFMVDIVNNNKKLAVMADLESKGQFVIKPDIVVATTNNKEVDAHVSIAPISILRRFNFHVEVRIKKEFATPGGMLKKGVKAEEHKYDIWDLDLYRWELEEGTNKHVIVDRKDNLSYGQVMFILAEEAAAYKKNQNSLVKEVANYKNVERCSHKIMKDICPVCRNMSQPVLEDPVDVAEPVEGLRDPRIVVQAGWENYAKRQDALFMNMKMNVQYLCAIKLFIIEMKQKKRLYIGIALVMELLYFIALFYIWSSSVAMIMGYAAFNSLCLGAAVVGRIYMISLQPLYQNVREAMKDMIPRSNRRRIGALIGIASCACVMTACYKAWRRLRIEPQGAQLSMVPGLSNDRNIYTEQLIKPMPINMDVRTASCDQIVTALEKRMYMARFTDSEDGHTPTSCVILPICSETCLIPYHVARCNYKYMTIFKGSSNFNNVVRKISIKDQWRRILETDYCVLSSPIIADQKDLRKWFPKGSILDTDSIEACALKNAGCKIPWLRARGTKNEHGEFEFTCSNGVERINCSSAEVHMAEYDLRYWGGTYMSPIPTWSGMCGCPIVTDRTSGPFIIGLHSAGSANGGNAGRFCTIMQDDIQNTLDMMRGDIVPHSQMHESADYKSALDFVDTPFRYTLNKPVRCTSLYVKGEYDLYGYNTSPPRSFRSNVKISMWSEDLAARGLPRLHEAPQIINTYAPWNVWLTNVSHPSKIEADVLKVARDDYINHILKGIEQNPEWDFKNKIKPLGHLVVLAGLDGVRGCDAINRKTSMGIPYCKPKSQFIERVDYEVEGISCPVDISDKLKREIQHMEDQLKLGQRVYVAHRCNLKDEAVKINKLKVRVFLGSPFAYLYLMRKYFLPLSMFMQEHPILFETAVGMKCYSKEWTKLYNYITRFGGTRMIGGDYKAYDQKMEIGLTKASFEVLLTLCKLAGYTDEEMTICRGLMTETIAGCYDLAGEWIGLTSANPSGHALTVIINSIANSIQVRCGFFKLRPFGCKERFSSVVALTTYGDDNLMGVKPGYAWFNHTTLSAVLATWGITYTMADKDAESVEYLPIEQCTFLKRRWVWSDVYQQYMCPIEEESILKTLHTYLDSSVMDVKEQHAQLLLNANREYFMYGEEVFRERNQMLNEILVKYRLEHCLKNMRVQTKEELEIWIQEM